MSYKSGWIVLAILVCAAAYTDVTMINCPAQFNISIYNTTSDATAATMGSLVYGSLSSSASK